MTDKMGCGLVGHVMGRGRGVERSGEPVLVTGGGPDAASYVIDGHIEIGLPNQVQARAYLSEPFIAVWRYFWTLKDLVASHIKHNKNVKLL